MTLIRIMAAALWLTGMAPSVAAAQEMSSDKFLALCQSDWDWCKEHMISAVSVHNTTDAIHPDQAQSCPPQNIQTRADEVTKRVVAWLRDHADARAASESQGIEAALKALYPCGKN